MTEPMTPALCGMCQHYHEHGSPCFGNLKNTYTTEHHKYFAGENPNPAPTCSPPVSQTKPDGTNQLEALRAQLAQAEKDRDTLAAEVRAWRYSFVQENVEGGDVDGADCRLNASMEATDTSDALHRSNQPMSETKGAGNG